MAKTVVVDTSVALKWVLTESDSEQAISLVDVWRKNNIEVIAPSLLIYEASNTLYQNVRTGKITLDTANRGLDIILKVVLLEFLPSTALSTQAMEIASRFELSASYDAHFLALARQKNCELWTADTRMWKAVTGKLEWVRNISEYQPS